jgi:peptidoglycan hydrolase-like protein with peptidoglycan-binding domain
MQLISGSVGANGANAVHDVALVQAILVKTIRPASADGARAAGPYLASYDGVYGNQTLASIKAFQTDNPPPRAAGATGAAPAPTGLIAPGDATWAALLLRVPTDFANLRALPLSKIVYVEATAAQLQAKLTAVAAMTFNATFRTNAEACINGVYTAHGIAMGVVPGTGDRRTFETQHNLFIDPRGVTGAGPGESNHNFGQAADFSFSGLRWLRSNGTVVENETHSLHRLDPPQQGAAPARIFWTTFQGIGIALGLFRGPAGDQPHLQTWNDSTIYTPTRLADLLQRSGNMHWAKSRDTPYQCDFGLGGAFTAANNVGTADQLWTSNATVTVATLTAARTAAALAAARRIGPRAVPAAVAPSTAAEVTAMKAALRTQMELADTNWQAWTPS